MISPEWKGRKERRGWWFQILSSTSGESRFSNPHQLLGNTHFLPSVYLSSFLYQMELLHDKGSFLKYINSFVLILFFHGPSTSVLAWIDTDSVQQTDQLNMELMFCAKLGVVLDGSPVLFIPCCFVFIMKTPFYILINLCWTLVALQSCVIFCYRAE